MELLISTIDEAIAVMPSDRPPPGKLRPIPGGLAVQYDAYKLKLGDKAMSKTDLVRRIWASQHASTSNFANVNRGDRFVTAVNAVRIASELSCRVESIVHVETKDDRASLKNALQVYLSNWPLPLHEYSTSKLAELLGLYVKSRDVAKKSPLSPIALDIRRAAARISDYKTAEQIDLLKDVVPAVGRLYADGDVHQAELKLEEYRKKLRDLGLHLLSAQYTAKELWEGGWDGADKIWLKKVLVLKVSQQKTEEKHTISRSKEPVNDSFLEDNDDVFFKELEDFLEWSNGKIV